MSRKQAFLGLGLSAVLAALALLFWRSGGGDADAVQSRSTGRDRAGSSHSAALARQITQAEANAAAQQNWDGAALIAHLQQKYGARVGHHAIQIRMIEELMRYFQTRDPAHWEDAVRAILRAAFPERYADLAATFQHRLDYERWVEKNQERLAGLDERERRAALWDERSRLFGKAEAEEIWAAELKNQALGDALQAIDLEQNGVADKLAMFKASLHDVYGEETERRVENHQQELINRFLDLSSVQQQLDAMKPEARAKSLNDIRKSMGLGEEAIKRWQDLDHTRDERWALGEKYMAERKALSERATGTALETELAALRSRYFGPEAETIAHEEETGYFRYTQPRRWGRN